MAVKITLPPLIKEPKKKSLIRRGLEAVGKEIITAPERLATRKDIQARLEEEARKKGRIKRPERKEIRRRAKEEALEKVPRTVFGKTLRDLAQGELEKEREFRTSISDLPPARQQVEQAKRLAEKTGKVSKFIAQEFVAGISTVGKTIIRGVAGEKAAERFAEPELEKRLLGRETRPLQEFAAEAKQAVREAGGTSFEVAATAPLALVAGLFVESPVGLPGKLGKPFVKQLVKDTTEELVEATLRQKIKDVPEEFIQRIKAPIAKATSEKQVSDILVREGQNFNKEVTQAVTGKPLVEKPKVPEVKPKPKAEVPTVKEVKIGDKVISKTKLVPEPKKSQRVIPTPEKPVPIKSQTIPDVSKIKETVETPIEFALGKQIMQKRNVDTVAKPLKDRANKIKLAQEESEELFNVFENPEKFKLSSELKTKGGDKLLSDAEELNRFLTQEKKSRELLDTAWSDDTYLRTILENADGTPASAERIAKLKNAANANFREQLTLGQRFGGSKLSTKNVQDVSRKFATADTRDKVLKRFGLRTKRDFIASMASNVQLTRKITANQDFNVSLRNLAKSGKRSDILEVYDPVDVSNFRDKERLFIKKQRDIILSNLRRDKVITDSEFRNLKTLERLDVKKEVKTLKESQQFALDDIDNLMNALKRDLEVLEIQRVKKKVALTTRAKQRIELVKKASKKRVNDFYGEIAIRKGKLSDEGFFDLGGIRGVEPLRGVMVKQRDFNAVKEMINELGVSSFEDIARSLKLVQATLDLFQLPQALRASIQLNGPIKGSWDWLRAVTTTANKTAKVGDIVDASEFVQLGRHKDFDIDIWNKFQRTIEQDTSKAVDLLRKADKVTNVPGVRQVKKIVGGTVKALEKYQWETVMIPLKVDAWKRKVANLRKAFPNKNIREIKIEAGRAVNDFFGGQNWEKLLIRNPKAFSRGNQRFLRILLFAPDYLTSTLRTLRREAIDIFRGGIKGRIARQSLITKVTLGLGMANAISYMTTGHSTFENDDINQFYKIQTPFKDQKGNPYYLDIMGNWGQTFNIMNRPVDAIRGKVGGIGRTAIDALSGEGITGRGFSPIPFNARGLLNHITSEFLGKDADFGVPDTIDEAALIQMFEFFGVSGAFSGGKSKKATLIKSFENPENLWKFILGLEVKPKKKPSGKIDVKLPDLAGLKIGEQIKVKLPEIKF